MPTKSAFSVVGLAHKVCLAAEAQGYTPELLNALAEHPSLLGELRKVQLGLSEIKPNPLAIDCDADPLLPNRGWRVEEHRKCGVIVWDSAKVGLYLSKHQKGDESIEGNKLRKELVDKFVLNANVLDYLLAHPDLIPGDWRGTAIFFWGTIYGDSFSNRYVRCLRWDGRRWGQDHSWLGSAFCSRYGPAVVAS